MGIPALKIEAAEALLSRTAAPQSGADWANDAREAAKARLMGMGGPMRRDEYWRFTNPAPFLNDMADVAIYETDAVPVFSQLDRLKLMFVDGVFRPDLSGDLALENIEIVPLSEALADANHWGADLFGKLEAEGQSPVDRPLAALNTACAEEGFAMRVTGEVSKPISLVYKREKPGAEAMIRNLLKVEKGGKVTILESGPAAARHNKVWETDIADGAEFHHVRTQGRDHGRVAGTAMFTRLGEESVFKSCTLTVNGILTRNEHVITLTGDDAIAHVAGATAGDGRGFLHDDTVFITHDAENCESRQVFKKVLRNGATGVFQGKILVKEGAQKTDGYQISQGLLLDDDSNFLAKPELEIYADDVACSHGSTCGAVDETALFYLLSRGVPRVEAQNMLVLAFLDEAIQEIEDDTIADEMRRLIGGWLERRST